jgi:hypothetical protein
VPKQRLLSPEIHRWRRWSCGTSSSKLPIDLGFGLRRVLNRRRGGVRGRPGGPHHPLARPGGGRTTPWCGCSLAPLRLSFGLRHVGGKNRRFGLCLSNSENISCVAFLKHKNSRKQGTGTVASRQ